MYLNYRELDADIIIIGAGITGLCVAHYLLKKDPHIDFLVLDVNEKWNFDVKGQYSSLWDMKWSSNPRLKKATKTSFIDEKFANIKGDQLVCSKQKKLIQLLHELDVELVKNLEENGKIIVDHENIYEVSNRQQILDFLSFQEAKLLNIFCDQIDNLCKKVSFEDPSQNGEMIDYDKMNMETFLDNLIDKQKVKDVVKQTFLLNCGLRSSDVSALFFLAYCNSTHGIRNQFHRNIDGLHQYWIEGGAENIRSKIVDIVGDDSIVQVSEVSEISWDDCSAGIRTPHEYFFANKVIYTLSEAETANIKFTPPLSDEKRIISNNFVKGTLKKFEIEYEKPFWKDKRLSGDVYVMNNRSRNGPIQMCLSMSEKGGNPILIGLAEQDSDKSDILKQLAIYFGEAALDPKNYVETRASFLELDFPLGCVSMNCFKNIRDNSERIIWASPETSTNWYGTVAGSLEAGFEGALRVLLDTKPSVLAFEDLEIVSPYEVNIPQRRLGIFGFKWHKIIPTLLLAVFLIVQVKKYFVKKSPALK